MCSRGLQFTYTCSCACACGVIDCVEVSRRVFCGSSVCVCSFNHPQLNLTKPHPYQLLLSSFPPFFSSSFFLSSFPPFPFSSFILRSLPSHMHAASARLQVLFVSLFDQVLAEQAHPAIPDYDGCDHNHRRKLRRRRRPVLLCRRHHPAKAKDAIHGKRRYQGSKQCG